MPNSSTAADDTVLSFSGDICEDGTLSVIFVGVAFVFLGSLKVALSRFTARRERKKAVVKRLVKNSRLEDILVLPFVPTTLEHFVLIIYGAWFAMTITMGATRYVSNEKRLIII